MYRFQSIKTVNEAEVYAFMKAYKTEKIKNIFKHDRSSFDGSLLCPSKAKQRQNLLQTAYISIIWRNANCAVLINESLDDY